MGFFLILYVLSKKEVGIILLDIKKILNQIID